MKPVIEILQGDVTDQSVDAIVNAANSELAGGGGVDGAIHHRGGPSIMEETQQRYPTGCPTGSAVISRAGKLPAQFVIHAVGPVWSGGNRGEMELLTAAYQTCLQIAVDHQCRSIAFPSLSTGAYRYPMEQAARIALATTRNFLAQHGSPALVKFVLFGDTALNIFQTTWEEVQR